MHARTHKTHTHLVHYFKIDSLNATFETNDMTR